MNADNTPGLAVQEIEDRIMTFLRQELLPPEIAVNRDDDLLSGEVFDSMALMRLAAFVEEEFLIVFQPTDYVIENFQSVAVLAEFVRRARDRTGGPAGDSAR